MRVLLASGAAVAFLAQTSPAKPIDAASAILDAFRTHTIVALGEGPHGNEPGHRFRLGLIRAASFAETVNDIVIEGANARYQELVERYVNGGAGTLSELRVAWQESTQVQLLDQPHFAELVEAVRQVNATLPADRHLRVLLADPPIDWTGIHSASDHRQWIEMRDIFGADVIQREVVEQGRHALVVFGDNHLQRRNIGANYESTGLAQTVMSRLEDRYHVTVFSILTSTVPDLSRWEPPVTSWPVPSIVQLRGTPLGAVEFADMTNNRMPRLRLKDGQPDFSAPIPPTEWRTLKTEDQFDALLYLGPLPPNPLEPRSPLCDDGAYIQKRLARMALVGSPPFVIEQFKHACGLP